MNRAGVCFCGAAAIHVCRWPVERFTREEVRTLRPGDEIRAQVTFGEEERYRWKVHAIEPAPAGQVCVHYAVTEIGKAYALKRSQVVAPDVVLLVKTRGTCDSPVCERHARELADDRGLCADHWNAWESVA
jgi:hypothetical protein